MKRRSFFRSTLAALASLALAQSIALAKPETIGHKVFIWTGEGWFKQPNNEGGFGCSFEIEEWRDPEQFIVERHDELVKYYAYICGGISTTQHGHSEEGLREIITIGENFGVSLKLSHSQSAKSSDAELKYFAETAAQAA